MDLAAGIDHAVMRIRSHACRAGVMIRLAQLQPALASRLGQPRLDPAASEAKAKQLRADGDGEPVGGAALKFACSPIDADAALTERVALIRQADPAVVVR